MECVAYMRVSTEKQAEEGNGLESQKRDIELYCRKNELIIADWYGREIIKIDTWYPSSQICSNCGHKDGKKALSVREWTCPVCGTHHERDINAAINILNEGLRMRTAGTVEIA